MTQARSQGVPRSQRSSRATVAQRSRSAAKASSIASKHPQPLSNVHSHSMQSLSLTAFAIAFIGSHFIYLLDGPRLDRNSSDANARGRVDFRRAEDALGLW